MNVFYCHIEWNFQTFKPLKGKQDVKELRLTQTLSDISICVDI